MPGSGLDISPWPFIRTPQTLAVSVGISSEESGTSEVEDVPTVTPTKQKGTFQTQIAAKDFSEAESTGLSDHVGVRRGQV